MSASDSMVTQRAQLADTAARFEHLADVSRDRAVGIGGVKAALADSAAACVDAIEGYQQRVSDALLSRHQSQLGRLLRLEKGLVKSLSVSCDAAAISASQLLAATAATNAYTDSDQLAVAMCSYSNDVLPCFGSVTYQRVFISCCDEIMINTIHVMEVCVNVHVIAVNDDMWDIDLGSFLYVAGKKHHRQVCEEDCCCSWYELWPCYLS